MDTYLPTQGVHFLPWIGSRYRLGFKGKRLLILGESHYPWADPEVDRGPTDPLPPTATREVVTEAIKRGKTRSAFWFNLEQAFLNLQRQELDVRGDKFWNSVAVYNFVQETIGTGPR